LILFNCQGAVGFLPTPLSHTKQEKAIQIADFSHIDIRATPRNGTKSPRHLPNSASGADYA
jgi:hypothetical protein